ncbi:MAG: hypothetical protein KAH38_03295, partial [Candidatus Hydrogenedentes bacterium]|nr:hypothetical protein [Candidatus Hydrogenedentota bacterium]
MIMKRDRITVGALTCILVTVLLCGAMPQASADRTPRILLAGDSWTGFMLAFHSYSAALNARPDLTRWVEVGNRTAVMGARAWEILENPDMDYFNLLTNELTKYPNVDVVVMTLSGNDILRGTKGVDPGNYNRTVDIENCYLNNPASEPWVDTNECLAWMTASLETQIGTIVDHILSIRPDIRVALVSYDYGAREPEGGWTIEDQHLAFLQIEEGKRHIATTRDRVEYVNNYGLMQHLYGIPEAVPPIDPGVVPPPCLSPDPPCASWPGGDPSYLSPLFTYIDQDIHLTDFGYLDVANRSLDFCIQEWLNYPKALEILPLDKKSPFFQFQVTFSHPVQGVTAGDFEVHIQDKGLLKAMSVTDILPVTGPADVYTVTVDMDGSMEAAYIIVKDFDTITRSDTGAALGGTGLGNGEFVYNGLYEFVDMPPPDDSDFDASIQYLYMASEAYEYLLQGFSFNPEVFDANGDFLADGNIEDEPYIIPGNALLDAYEFALIRACIDDPALDLSANGGIVAADVITAWENNLTWMQYTVGGANGLASIVLPGLDTVLAGFYTLGDLDSRILVGILVTAIAQVEEFPFAMQLEGLEDTNYEYYPDWLSWGGDASGNGWTNEQLYAYYAPDGLDAYLTAALTPTIIPKTGAGSYFPGRFTRIAVLEHAKWNSPWQWYRDGVPLVDDGRITGANQRNLDILSLQPGDSGDYTCDYIPKAGTKAEIYGPIHIVVADGTVPAGSAMMLTLIALAIGGAG